MHYDRASEIMERCSKARFHPVLHTVIAIPYQAFEERINQPHNEQGSNQLRSKTSALGNSTGDNGRNRGGKGHQKEKLY